MSFLGQLEHGVAQPFIVSSFGVHLRTADAYVNHLLDRLNTRDGMEAVLLTFSSQKGMISSMVLGVRWAFVDHWNGNCTLLTNGARYDVAAGWVCATVAPGSSWPSPQATCCVETHVRAHTRLDFSIGSEFHDHHIRNAGYRIYY